MTDATDAQLAQRSAQGDQAAFVELIRRNRGSLAVLIRRLVCDADHADDLLQETVIRCWQSMANLRDPQRVRAWLFQVARNCCRDHHRASGRREQPTEMSDLEIYVNRYGRTGPREQLQTDLEDALGSLSLAERSAIELFYLKGHSIKELSAITDSSTSAVKTRLFSARNHLRSYLGVNNRKGDEE